MLKKVKVVMLIGVITALCLLLFGCKSIFIKQNDKTKSITTVSKTFQDIVDLQLKYTEKGINTVKEYIDIPEHSSANNRSLESTFHDISEISKYLPSDLKSLKKKKVSGFRSSEYEEISLDEELTQLITAFDRELQSVLPDPSPALSLPFVEETENGITMGGDCVIPLKSLQGAVTVEILNSAARGDNIEDILESFEAETQDYLRFSSDVNRGLIEAGQAIWPYGMVNYRWGNIDPIHKEAVKKAMKTWNNSTNGRVKFQELSNDCWTNFQLAIWVIGNVTISTEISNDWDGLATLGYVSGNRGILQISKNVISEAALNRVPLHELGHNLGLWHEHQRYDRNDWIIVNQTGSNYEILPQYISGLRWGWARIRIGWWTISVPYPIFWKTVNSYTIGTFDFYSIMIYSGFKTKKAQGNIPVGGWIPYNTTLSQIDIETIQRLY